MQSAAPSHASAFAYEGFGCLLLGESGSGKSRVLAEAILHGARLIADDQVQLSLSHSRLVASAPTALEGVMELRGLGLIRQKNAATTHPIHLVLQLDASADNRLPEAARFHFEGSATPHYTVAPPPILSVPSLLLFLQALGNGDVLPTDWRP
jgi:HPr kinase/phosphorylase